MPNVWLISGIPGAGKTTAARLLATRFERAVHIEGDGLQRMIVSGSVLANEEPGDEATNQILLNIHNQCLLARSYADAGFTVVIDYVIVVRWTFEAFVRGLEGLPVRYVVLDAGKDVALRRDEPREKSLGHKDRTGRSLAAAWLHLDDLQKTEMADAGLWVDNSTLTPHETVEAILARQEQALLIGRS